MPTGSESTEPLDNATFSARTFARRFARTFVGLVGAAAFLYFLSDWKGRALAIAVVVLAIVDALRPQLHEVLGRLRDYPVLLRTAADHQAHANELRDANA